MNILVHIKNYFATRKDFKVMETNLKEFVAGDRKHLPSDGGLFFKLRYELKDWKLLGKYYKTVRKTLESAIQEYLEQEKYREQSLQEDYVDIDPYLNMTLEDLYEAGTDFYIPISNKIIYKGKKAYLRGLACDILGGRMERSLTCLVPELRTGTNPYRLNFFMPPLPLEFIYDINNDTLKGYLELGRPASFFENEEAIEKYIALDDEY